jgi:hypothetical protein
LEQKNFFENFEKNNRGDQGKSLATFVLATFVFGNFRFGNTNVWQFSFLAIYMQPKLRLKTFK